MIYNIKQCTVKTDCEHKEIVNYVILSWYTAKVSEQTFKEMYFKPRTKQDKLNQHNIDKNDTGQDAFK